MAESSRRDILARAVIDAWAHNEPDGMLLRALYEECGMSPEDALATIRRTQGER
jgi:hypothetical protein